MALAPLVGMIGAPLLQGVAGGSILGLSTGALGAGLAGITSLAQGKGILGAGMDALGGYGGASGIANLAKSGQSAVAMGAADAAKSAGSSAAQSLIDDAAMAGKGLMEISPTTLASEYQAAAAPASAGYLAANPSSGLADSLSAGAKDLFSPGGMGRFKAATGSSALSSLGMPAAGALMNAMPATSPVAAEESYWGGPSESIEDLRRRVRGYAEGGITDLGMTAGAFDARTKLPAYNEPMDTYAKGGVLSGPGDGVSDSIPAVIGDKQPARLADGEFVIPARIVSELGNGSTKAGARRLYEMMDRVKKRREKSVGKHNIAVDTKAYKELPA
jgi:hypothetical protein